ncbi:hypothetical protein D3C76_1647220 [compost metagenome]
MAAMLTVNSTRPAFSSSMLATLRTFSVLAPRVSHRINSRYSQTPLFQPISTCSIQSFAGISQPHSKPTSAAMLRRGWLRVSR